MNKHRIISMLIMVCILISIFAVPAAAYTSSSPTFYKPWWANTYNVSTSLNVRSSTSTSSNSIGTLGPNDQIQVIGNNTSGWYKVLYDGDANTIGYCSASFLSTGLSSHKLYCVVNVSAANYREGCGFEYDTITTIPYGDSVSVIGYWTKASGGWYECVWGKMNGCLHESVALY